MYFLKILWFYLIIFRHILPNFVPLERMESDNWFRFMHKTSVLYIIGQKISFMLFYFI